MIDPEDLKYTKEHEWAAIQGEVSMIGITDYAQKQLGDVVFVELPQVGRKLQQGEVFGVVESVKAVSDLFSPLTGEVVAVNEDLTGSPQLINNDPFHEGWIMKIRLLKPEEISTLMSRQEYEMMVRSEGK